MTTVGLIIVALFIITIAFAKFGVFNKIIDYMIHKKGLSTGFTKEALEKIYGILNKLTVNDEDVKGQLTNLEGMVCRNTDRICKIENSMKQVEITAYKKSVFDKSLFLIDRMADGIRYMLEGMNSETKDYLLNQLCFEDLAIWDGLCKVMKAPQYWREETDRPANWRSEKPSQEA